ncbi:Rv3654c family TadE-like protein [Streptomyces doebereineriae]|uniref:Rv3654c family TadE-like protein n=1 Tax=Streptomyces doebereineriae TaxID=3075528 RepID=UPI00374E157C
MGGGDGGGRRMSGGSTRSGSSERGVAVAWPPAARSAKARCAEVGLTGARRAVARFAGVHLAATRSDRGSATVWSVGAIAVLCVVFGVVLALGQAVVVRHRAAGGADLAALAAADHWAEGSVVACARAEGVARDQGLRLVRCEMVGEISDVTAASGRGPFTAEVRARAGPAGPVTSQAPLPPESRGAPRPGGPAAPGAPVPGPLGGQAPPARSAPQ